MHLIYFFRNLKKDFGYIRAELPENDNLTLPILKMTGKKMQINRTYRTYCPLIYLPHIFKITVNTMKRTSI